MEILRLRLARLPTAVLEYEPTLLPLSGEGGMGGGGGKKRPDTRERRKSSLGLKRLKLIFCDA